MGSMTLGAALGFVLGLRHALDPDHVVAVSTMVSRTRRLGASWLLGAFWGLGHTATVFAAGAAIVLLKIEVPPALESRLEAVVGGMLVFLGGANLRGRWTGRWNVSEHEHGHSHDGGHGHHLVPSASGHSHRHAHSPALESLLGRESLAPGGLARAFGVGAVHGLAGSTAVSLLVMAALPTAASAVVFLAVFSLGTLAGMALVSALMEATMLWTLRRWRAERWLEPGVGLVSVGFGLYIMYRQILGG